MKTCENFSHFPPSVAEYPRSKNGRNSLWLRQYLSNRLQMTRNTMLDGGNLFALCVGDCLQARGVVHEDMKSIKTIQDVVEGSLCCGCGACAYAARGLVAMEDHLDDGIRPALVADVDLPTETLEVCPGVGLAHQAGVEHPNTIPGLASAWGPILGVYEGFATDSEIRLAGSSGGAATAIALYCLEQGGMHGVLHTGARKDVPFLNETVMSYGRAELLSRTGSRYAPASPCDGLGQIVSAPGLCVFIGKPCDVAGASKARAIYPDLEKNMGVSIAFFCAGTPSTRGTLEMLKRMGVTNPEDLVSLRYRGEGWPGLATALTRAADGKEESHQLTYEESWGEVLSKHQQWRCKLCADHTGEFADIAVGDPWYRAIEPGDAGRSLILARSERGLELIRGAAKAGYLHIECADPNILPQSQPNLLRTRGALWGRLLTCRLMGVAAPAYMNMPLFPHWWRALSFRQKLQSILGTVKRLSKRKYGRVRTQTDAASTGSDAPSDG